MKHLRVHSLKIEITGMNDPRNTKVSRKFGYNIRKCWGNLTWSVEKNGDIECPEVNMLDNGQVRFDSKPYKICTKRGGNHW